MYISFGAWTSFSCKKGEFNLCFNRLERSVEESRPGRPVDPIGAGRPDRCRSTRQVSISGVS